MSIDDQQSDNTLSSDIDAKIAKDMTKVDYEQKIAELEAKIEELEGRVVTDFLTGIYNRRGLEALMNREWNRIKRLDSPKSQIFSIICIDKDNFKSINDKYGHLSGDIALKSIAELLESSVRESDIVARFGGDEFVVVLLSTDTEEAKRIADELVDVVAKNKITSIDGRDFYCKMSAGVSTYKDHQDWREVLHEADQALLQVKAKDKGRALAYEV